MANKKNLEDNKMAKKSQTQESVQTPAAAVPVATQQAASVVTPAKKATKSVSKKEETPVVQQAAPVSTPVATQQSAPTVKKVVKAPSKKTEQVQAVAPVQESAAPVKEKKARTSSKKSESTTVVQQSAPAPATESTPSTEEPVGVQALFDSCVAQVESLIELQKNMVSSLRRGWKLFQKESKEAAKNHQREKRRAKRDPNRKKREPTGFALATPITSALCQFLELPAGSKLSRTEATKKVTAYIKAQNLQNPQKKRSFVPDAKLAAILGPLHEVDKTRGYDYFNLQRYMTPHFIKTPKQTTASATTSA